MSTQTDLEAKARARAPIAHELKCHPGPFQAVKDGTKSFEWRKDDRDYRVGDTLWLREWTEKVNIPNGYTGGECHCLVTYIIREGFGIPEGYCIMGLRSLTQPSVDVRGLTADNERLLALVQVGDAMHKMLAELHYNVKRSDEDYAADIDEVMRLWKLETCDIAAKEQGFTPTNTEDK